jgi:hypothetical protein
MAAGDRTVDTGGEFVDLSQSRSCVTVFPNWPPVSLLGLGQIALGDLPTRENRTCGLIESNPAEQGNLCGGTVNATESA